MDRNADAPSEARVGSGELGLARSHTEALAAAFDRAGEAIVITDDAGFVRLFNAAAERLFGWPAGEIIGQRLSLLLPEAARDDYHRRLEAFADGAAPRLGPPEDADVACQRRDGTRFPAHVRVSDVQTELGIMHVGVATDVSARRLLEETLRESEGRYHELFENLADAAFIADSSTGRILETNRRGERLLARPRSEIVGMHQTELHPPAESELHRRSFAEAGTDTRHDRGEVLQKNGARIPVEISSVPAIAAGRPVVLRLFRDISERQRADAELLKLTWALKAIGRSNAALVHADSEQSLIQTCCEAVTSEGGYALAWVGWAKDDAGHSVEIVASAGPATRYLDDFRVTWDESPLGLGPVGRAIRTGRPAVFNEALTDASFAPWAARAREAGIGASVALPIRERGLLIGTMCVYSSSPSAFGEPEVELFRELAEDLGYGLEARRTRVAYEAGLVEREQQAKKLRAVLESAIAAVAATVEKRDPYTAGHERRVADLAAAIARELGLDENRIEGLHLAGIVHDIGKVQVPAEILSKPTRLLPIEFELIKIHPEAGYEILKDIEFPWPIAEIVRQHHEYLDGSGYPRGLRGDGILEEARIMTVADIVEAMASHRPYRPGLGIDVALEQVLKMRGEKLDPTAVDACVRLFRERGYTLPP